MKKQKQWYMYDPAKRWFYTKETENSEPTPLGEINTRMGGLTHEQKLQLIRANGEWLLL
jgi:hypothetical protein